MTEDHFTLFIPVDHLYIDISKMGKSHLSRNETLKRKDIKPTIPSTNKSHNHSSRVTTTKTFRNTFYFSTVNIIRKEVRVDEKNKK